MADIPTIKLPAGEQYWVMIRTNRDGASADQIASSVGNLFRWVLRTAKANETGITDLNQVIPTGTNEWRVGSARPIQLVSVSHDRPSPFPAGTVVATRATYPGPGIPTVSGDDPWWVVVRFWWRGPATEVEWPSLLARVGSLTSLHLADYAVDQTDWTLDTALVPTEKHADPGQQTWGEAQTENVKETASKVAGTAVKVVAGVTVAAAVTAILITILKRKNP